MRKSILVRSFLFGICCLIVWVGLSCMYALAYPWIVPPWIDRWFWAGAVGVLAGVGVLVSYLITWLRRG